MEYRADEQDEYERETQFEYTGEDMYVPSTEFKSRGIREGEKFNATIDFRDGMIIRTIGDKNQYQPYYDAPVYTPDPRWSTFFQQPLERMNMDVLHSLANTTYTDKYPGTAKPTIEESEANRVETSLLTKIVTVDYLVNPSIAAVKHAAALNHGVKVVITKKEVSPEYTRLVASEVKPGAVSYMKAERLRELKGDLYFGHNARLMKSLDIDGYGIGINLPNCLLYNKHVMEFSKYSATTYDVKVNKGRRIKTDTWELDNPGYYGYDPTSILPGMEAQHNCFTIWTKKS
jgi:hypothetical protein